MPWLLLVPYLWPLLLLFFVAGEPPDKVLPYVAGLLAVIVVLAAFGPFFVVFFVLVTIGIWSGRTPYLGDCRSMGEEMIFFLPMALALPGACLLTSRLIYHLGREALSPASRRLGNIVFPFLGFLYATAVIEWADYKMDWALKYTNVCGGG